MTVAIEEKTTDHNADDTHSRIVRRPRKTSRAKSLLIPNDRVPATQSNGDDQIDLDNQQWHVVAVQNKSQANATVQPATRLPATSTLGSGSGHGRIDIPNDPAAPDPVVTLRELQSHRTATIKMQLRIDNQCRALMRRAMGWRMDLPEKERKALNDRAAAVVSAVQEGEPVTTDADLADKLRPFIMASLNARRPFDSYRAEIEKRMKGLARELPVWRWAESVRGFAELSLASIVGEAGDLSNYANPGKLWKRMGLAVFDGKAQGKRLDKIEAERNGYSPSRRSIAWNIGACLIKSDGPFKVIYDDRKAYEKQRDPAMSKMHAHRRAQRYMEKRLLKQLWQAWRQAILDASPSGTVPVATSAA